MDQPSRYVLDPFSRQNNPGQFSVKRNPDTITIISPQQVSHNHPVLHLVVLAPETHERNLYMVTLISTILAAGINIVIEFKTTPNDTPLYLSERFPSSTVFTATLSITPQQTFQLCSEINEDSLVVTPATLCTLIYSRWNLIAPYKPSFVFKSHVFPSYLSTVSIMELLSPLGNPENPFTEFSFLLTSCSSVEQSLNYTVSTLTPQIPEHQSPLFGSLSQLLSSVAQMYPHTSDPPDIAGLIKIGQSGNSTLFPTLQKLEYPPGIDLSRFIPKLTSIPLIVALQERCDQIERSVDQITKFLLDIPTYFYLPPTDKEMNNFFSFSERYTHQGNTTDSTSTQPMIQNHPFPVDSLSSFLCHLLAQGSPLFPPDLLSSKPPPSQNSTRDIHTTQPPSKTVQPNTEDTNTFALLSSLFFGSSLELTEISQRTIDSEQSHHPVFDDYDPIIEVRSYPFPNVESVRTESLFRTQASTFFASFTPNVVPPPSNEQTHSKTGRKGKKHTKTPETEQTSDNPPRPPLTQPQLDFIQFFCLQGKLSSSFHERCLLSLQRTKSDLKTLRTKILDLAPIVTKIIQLSIVPASSPSDRSEKSTNPANFSEKTILTHLQPVFADAKLISDIMTDSHRYVVAESEAKATAKREAELREWKEMVEIGWKRKLHKNHGSDQDPHISHPNTLPKSTRGDNSSSESSEVDPLPEDDDVSITAPQTQPSSQSQTNDTSTKKSRRKDKSKKKAQNAENLSESERVMKEFNRELDRQEFMVDMQLRELSRAEKTKLSMELRISELEQIDEQRRAELRIKTGHVRDGRTQLSRRLLRLENDLYRLMLNMRDWTWEVSTLSLPIDIDSSNFNTATAGKKKTSSLLHLPSPSEETVNMRDEDRMWTMQRRMQVSRTIETRVCQQMIEANESKALQKEEQRQRREVQLRKLMEASEDMLREDALKLMIEELTKIQITRYEHREDEYFKRPIISQIKGEPAEEPRKDEPVTEKKKKNRKRKNQQKKHTQPEPESPAPSSGPQPSFKLVSALETKEIPMHQFIASQKALISSGNDDDETKHPPDLISQLEAYSDERIERELKILRSELFGLQKIRLREMIKTVRYVSRIPTIAPTTLGPHSFFSTNAMVGEHHVLDEILEVGEKKQKVMKFACSEAHLCTWMDHPVLVTLHKKYYTLYNEHEDIRQPFAFETEGVELDVPLLLQMNGQVKTFVGKMQFYPSDIDAEFRKVPELTKTKSEFDMMYDTLLSKMTFRVFLRFLLTLSFLQPQLTDCGDLGRVVQRTIGIRLPLSVLCQKRNYQETLTTVDQIRAEVSTDLKEGRPTYYYFQPSNPTVVESKTDARFEADPTNSVIHNQGEYFTCLRVGDMDHLSDWLIPSRMIGGELADQLDGDEKMLADGVLFDLELHARNSFKWEVYGGEQKRKEEKKETQSERFLAFFAEQHHAQEEAKKREFEEKERKRREAAEKKEREWKAEQARKRKEEEKNRLKKEQQRKEAEERNRLERQRKKQADKEREEKEKEKLRKKEEERMRKEEERRQLEERERLANEEKRRQKKERQEEEKRRREEKEREEKQKQEEAERERQEAAAQKKREKMVKKHEKRRLQRLQQQQQKEADENALMTLEDPLQTVLRPSSPVFTSSSHIDTLPLHPSITGLGQLPTLDMLGMNEMSGFGFPSLDITDPLGISTEIGGPRGMELDGVLGAFDQPVLAGFGQTDHLLHSSPLLPQPQLQPTLTTNQPRMALNSPPLTLPPHPDPLLAVPTSQVTDALLPSPFSHPFPVLNRQRTTSPPLVTPLINPRFENTPNLDQSPPLLIHNPPFVTQNPLSHNAPLFIPGSRFIGGNNNHSENE